MQPTQYGAPLQPQQQYGAPVTMAQSTSTAAMMPPVVGPAYGAPAPMVGAQTANIKPVGAVGTQPMQPVGATATAGTTDSTLKAKRAGAGL